MFLLILFIPFIVRAETCDIENITIEEIVVEKTNGEVVEKTPPVIDVMNIMATYDSIKGEAEGLLLDYDIGIRGNLIELMKQMCIDKKSGDFYKDK